VRRWGGAIKPELNLTEIKEQMTSTIDRIDQDQSIQIQRDEFASEEYLDPNARLPRIQALRGATPKQCGYFIEINQAAKAGWLNFDEKTLVDYSFESSGETEQGILFNKMRMLVCPRTPVLALDKAATKEQQQNVFTGYYKKAIYGADENFTNFQAFEVLLLDKENKPLHQVPLSLKLKGAAQASFSQKWQEFVQKITSCHAISCGIPASEKAMTFKSLCVFAFEVKREMAGDKTKSPACKVTGYEVPTLESWKNYFVGYDTQTKEFVWQGLQPKRPLIQPEQIMAALPPVSDVEALEAAGIDF
jgi:hypothetical protein